MVVLSEDKKKSRHESDIDIDGIILKLQNNDIF